MASLIMIFSLVSRVIFPCAFKESNIVLLKEFCHLIYGLLHTIFLCMVSFLTVGALALVKPLMFVLLRARGFICWIKLFLRFEFSVPFFPLYDSSLLADSLSH